MQPRSTLLPLLLFVGMLAAAELPAQFQWNRTGDTVGFLATSILVLPDGTILTGTADGVYHSSDGGATFTQANTGLDGLSTIALSIGPGNEIYAGTDFGLYSIAPASLPDGTWQTRIAEDYIDAIGYFPGQPLFASACAAIDCDVVRTTDGDQYSPTDFGGNATALEVVSSGLVLAGTPIDGLFTSIDQGTTWLSTALTAPDIRDIELLGSGVLLVAADNLYRSTDGGQTWDTTLTASGIEALAVQGTQAYAATFEGVFHSTDDGQTWRTITNGLGDDAGTVTALGVNIQTGDVYAGTFDGHFYRLDEIPNAVESNATSGSRINLSAIPNPARSNVRFSFNAPHAGVAQLRIADPVGRIVATPLNTTVAAGEHFITWLPDAPGVYLVEITVGSEVSVRKVVVVE